MIKNKIKLDKEVLLALRTFADEWEEYKNPNFEKWYTFENVSLPLAFSISYGFSNPTKKGEEQLLEAYNHLVDFGNQNNCESLMDILSLDKEIPTYKVNIRIGN
jgi:hypothetical protein